MTKYVLKSEKCEDTSNTVFWAENVDDKDDWAYLSQEAVARLGGTGFIVEAETANDVAYGGTPVGPSEALAAQVKEPDIDHDHLRADDDGMGQAAGSASSDFLEAVAGNTAYSLGNEAENTVTGTLHGTDVHDIDKDTILDAVTTTVRSVINSDNWPDNGKQFILFTMAENEDGSYALGAQGLMDPNLAVEAAKHYFGQKTGIPFEVAEAFEAAMQQAGEVEEDDIAFASPFSFNN